MAENINDLISALRTFVQRANQSLDDAAAELTRATENIENLEIAYRQSARAVKPQSSVPVQAQAPVVAPPPPPPPPPPQPDAAAGAAWSRSRMASPAQVLGMMRKLHEISKVQSADPDTSCEIAWQQRKCRRLLRYPTVS